MCLLSTALPVGLCGIAVLFRVAVRRRWSGDFTIFFVTVTVLCFVAGTLIGLWVARPLSSQFVLHGVLKRIVATRSIWGLLDTPTTIAAVFAAYGPMWFPLANGLRIVSASLGAAVQGRRRLAW